MKKLVLAFFSLALVLIAAPNKTLAQRCALTEANAPEIRGVRLGMSAEQLTALFPNSVKRREIKDALAKAASATETVYLGFDPAQDASPGRFPGVDAISVGLSKNRVVDFTITYGGTTWTKIDDWAAKVAESFKLPGAAEWMTGPSESPNKVLRCSGVMIEAALQGGGSSIRVISSEHAMHEASQAGDEKKRREFKP